MSTTGTMPLPSAWTNYPTKYKLTGLQFNVSSENKITRRKTITVWQVAAASGGMLKFLTLLLDPFVSLFAGATFTTLVANRLFTWHEPDSFKCQHENEHPSEVVPGLNIKSGKLLSGDK